MSHSVKMVTTLDPWALKFAEEWIAAWNSHDLDRHWRLAFRLRLLGRRRWSILGALAGSTPSAEMG